MFGSITIIIILSISKLTCIYMGLFMLIAIIIHVGKGECACVCTCTCMYMHVYIRSISVDSDFSVIGSDLMCVYTCMCRSRASQTIMLSLLT